MSADGQTGCFDTQAGLTGSSDRELACVRQDATSEATIVPVILSGGAGSRLWPYSTEDAPKQFLALTGDRSLFRLTLDRVGDRKRFSAPIVVASERHGDLCDRELRDESSQAQLILEPCGRNTAPAIVMAAVAARAVHGDDALLLVMPSDHVLDDVAAFHAAIETGEAAARQGRLVTFGIPPTGPDTGFGYIQAAGDIDGVAGARDVARFVEKPQLEAAKKMVVDGQHFWNAGIFLFRVGTLLEEAAAHAPDICESAKLALENGRSDRNRLVADRETFAACRGESIDYAIMEHSSRVAVVPMSAGWSDLGSWDALADLFSGTEPNGPVTALDCDGCYIRSDGIEVAALGLSDLIVVVSGTKLLILPKGRSQEVKRLLSAMGSKTA